MSEFPRANAGVRPPASKESPNHPRPIEVCARPRAESGRRARTQAGEMAPKAEQAVKEATYAAEEARTAASPHAILGAAAASASSGALPSPTVALAVARQWSSAVGPTEDGLAVEEEMELIGMRDRLRLGTCCVSFAVLVLSALLVVRVHEAGAPLGLAAFELALAALLLVWTVLCAWGMVIDTRLQRHGPPSPVPRHGGALDV